MARIFAVIATLIVLGLVNGAIVGKEKQLAEGDIVYLELAPVDPRSLMQGDYMALRFTIANQVYAELPKLSHYQNFRHGADASDGYVIVSLDERNVATFKAVFTDQTLTNGELRLRYRVRNGAVKFATNAFFFQEGDAKVYSTARYGQFRVSNGGELLLTGLYDKDLHILKPDSK